MTPNAAQDPARRQGGIDQRILALAVPALGALVLLQLAAGPVLSAVGASGELREPALVRPYYSSRQDTASFAGGRTRAPPSWSRWA